MVRRAKSLSGSKQGPSSQLALDTSLLVPGDRVCVAVSGGADSTALLRSLLERRAELGVVLGVLHIEHGLRGAAGATDAAFVKDMAEKFELPCAVVSVDTPQRVADQKESVEEAARNLRYGVFREMLTAGKADKIATAHTLDDQAETVLMKLLRGAWSEGLSGIHPVLQWDGTSEGRSGCVIRPFLTVRRAEVEAYLRSLGQLWREDETNRSAVYMRNRVRHELMPVLRDYNPRIEQALAHVAANALAEERHWQLELARVLPQLLREGTQVRGGGRKVGTEVGRVHLALEVAALQSLDPGLRRRVLRATAERCGATLDFAATERLLAMVASSGRRGADSMDLPGGVRVARSIREVQFVRSPIQKQITQAAEVNPPRMPRQSVISEGPAVYELAVPGVADAPEFRLRCVATIAAESSPECLNETAPLPAARIRAWLPGDRVTLQHSRGPKKVKEVLERMGIRGEARKSWPVIEWQGKIVWMRGADLAFQEEMQCQKGTRATFEVAE
ncbi:MAG: tRNA lysidine(34) synthetase TilS [Acidobacteriaceae bacterium]